MSSIEEVKGGVIFRSEAYDQHDSPVLADIGAEPDVDPIVIESGDFKELSGSSISTKDIKAPAKKSAPAATPAKTK